MEKYYSIGEFAKLSGQITRTLREWDAKGILKPSYVHPKGYRYYSHEQVGQVSKVKETLMLEKIKKLYIYQCKTGKEVAEILGISKGRLNTILRNNGVTKGISILKCKRCGDDFENRIKKSDHCFQCRKEVKKEKERESYQKYKEEMESYAKVKEENENIEVKTIKDVKSCPIEIINNTKYRDVTNIFFES